MKQLQVGNAPCSWGTLENQDTSKQIPYRQMLDELVSEIAVCDDIRL